MKYSTPKEAEESKDNCLTANDRIREQELLLYEMTNTKLQVRPRDEWAMNIEYFEILNFALELWKTVIIVDHECKLDAYLWNIVYWTTIDRDWIAWY